MGVSNSDKVNFILNKIYPSTRSWQLWLEHEWRYRTLVNRSIFFDHEYKDGIELSLLVNTDTNICLRHYIKFNSNLNGIAPKNFVYDTNENVAKLKQHNCFEIQGDKINQETLPLDEYTKIINYFCLSDIYEDALVVHNKWYKLNKKAEQDIGKWYNKFYSQ